MDSDFDFPSEDALCDRLRAGDESAFQLVLDAWSPAMFRIARSFVSSAASAEEVVQDAWLGVVRDIAGFEGGSSLKTWAFRMLVEAAESHGARERREMPYGCPTCDDRGGHRHRSGRAADEEADDGVLDCELCRVVTDVMAGLPHRGRAVVALRDGEGFSADEVCDLLGISPGNQRTILYGARTAMREGVQRHRRREGSGIGSSGSGTRRPLGVRSAA